MSIIDKIVTNEQVIPVVESHLFDERDSARFAIGILAVGNQVTPGLENEMQGYFDLRRKVYVDQTGQLSHDDLHEDGTDRDSDDDRSVAFGIIENRGTDQRVVAATRLIIKGFGPDSEEQRPLPVEEFCPDLFAEHPSPRGSVEVSRLIARHEKAAIQEYIRWRMYAAVIGFTANHGLGPMYGVIEPWLQRHLSSTIPITKIGEPRYIEHYLDYNLPIEVHTDELMEQMKTTHPGVVEEMRGNEGSMSYFGKARNTAAPLAKVIQLPVASTETRLAIAD